MLVGMTEVTLRAGRPGLTLACELTHAVDKRIRIQGKNEHCSTSVNDILKMCRTQRQWNRKVRQEIKDYFNFWETFSLY
jgi:hypothetical protein